MKTNAIMLLVAVPALWLVGCSTTRHVTSESVTTALELDKANRFDVEILDTSAADTAFSDNAQRMASEILIDQLESTGLDYVGDKSPDISIQFRTYATTQPAYLNPSAEGEEQVTVTEVRRSPNGRVTQTKTVRTVDVSEASERIYLDPNSRIFLLEAYDEKTDALLWRGYTSIDDTGLTEDVLVTVIDLLTERLEEET